MPKKAATLKKWRCIGQNSKGSHSFIVHATNERVARSMAAAELLKIEEVKQI